MTQTFGRRQAPPALQRSSKIGRNTKTKAQSASLIIYKDQRDHYDDDDESTTDSAILHFNFVGVFHRVAEGEPIKIRQM